MINYTVWLVLLVGVLGFLFAKKIYRSKADTVKAISGVVAIVGVLFLLNVIPLTSDPVGNAVAGWQTNSVGTNGNSNGNTLTTVSGNPTISVAAQDLVSGAAVGNSITYQFNNGGGFVSTPATATAGQTLEILVTNGTTYHNVYVPSFTVTSASFPVTTKHIPNGTMSSNIYSTVGVVLSNGASGASNQTALGTGATYNFKDEMTPSSAGPVPPMICVLELSAGANASTVASVPAVAVSLNGQALTVTQGTPAWYTIVAANAAYSKVWTYDVPSLPAGTTSTFNIQLNGQPASSGSALDVMPTGAFAKKVCYTKEDFVYNGVHYFGVANGANTIQSIFRQQYIWY